MNAISRGKTVDRLVGSSDTLGELKTALLGNGNGTPGLITQINQMVKSSGLKSEDLKNLSLAALLLKLHNRADNGQKGTISKMMEAVKQYGLGEQQIAGLL